MVADDLVCRQARILYVGADGTETDIADCCLGASIRLKVGELNIVTLDVIGSADVRCHLEQLAVEQLPETASA